jgi:hypothetical protein
MSLIGIIALVFSCVLGLFLIGVGILGAVDPYNEVLWFVITTIVAVAVLVGGIFLGVELTTGEAKTFIASFEAEKTTIEYSINNDALSGLERVELVKLACELNGELAARKEKSTFWHWVYFEKGIYDNVEFIDLGGNGDGSQT